MKKQNIWKNQWILRLQWYVLLIRRHHDARVIQLMELWWEEYQHGCLRDQVSLMPCMHRLGFMPYFQFIEMDIRKNNMLKVMKHKESC